jgi:hypothetical protein
MAIIDMAVGDHCTAGEALPDAADDHHAKRVRSSTKDRKDGEQHCGDEQEPSQAQHALEPGGQRNDHDFGHKVGRSDPGPFGGGRADLALDRRQRGIDDRDVERGHERADGPGSDRQPCAARRFL